MIEKRKPKYPIKVLLNTFSIIDILINKKKSISLSELVVELNLYPSTIHRILDTLNYIGYVEKEIGTDKYQLGLKAIELGTAKLSQIDLIKESSIYLEKLSEKFNENVYLGVLFEGEVMFMAKKEAPRAIRYITHVGTRAYLHCTALGKVLLASLSLNEREKVIGNKSLPRLTKNTIVNKKELEKELGKIRKLGYAVDCEEYENEIRCLAAPITDHNRKVIAAISISGPSYRFNLDKQKSMIKAIITTSDKISSKLGFKKNESH